MAEDSKKIVDPSIAEDRDDLKADEEKLNKVKEIIHLLAKTVSLIKILPPDHSSVKGFTDELSNKTIKFLDEYWDLEIDIEEFSFIFQGKTAYHDDNPNKSLPFLFFKDGMQKLFFYKGLKKEQLQEFLEIIKKYYESPQGESDIVRLLWEKDFAHIRCFAPDAFLEGKIGTVREAVDFKIDKKKFETGTIELSQEDKNELSRMDLVSDFFEMEPEEPKELEKSEKFSSLSERESRALKFMLDTDRKLSPEKELVFLTLEMLYLEEKSERFSATLDVLAHTHQDIIKKGNLYFANQLLGNILELRQFLSSQSAENVEIIDRFLRNIKTRESLDSIKKTLLKGDVSDFDSFFKYLKSLGLETIPYLGELFEEIKSPDFRLKAVKYLKEIGKENLSVLMDIAREERPYLSKEVIAILGAIKEKRAIQFLANFIHSRNKSIKQAAIKSLGKIEDVKASRVLIGFLADEEEDLRILAAKNIHYSGDTSISKPVMNLVQKKTFKKKNRAEKQALLNIIGRSRTEEASAFLEALLKKSSFFARSKQIETRLCAVKTLEDMGTPEAIKALKEGRRLRPKRIKEACRLALEKISTESLTNNIG